METKMQSAHRIETIKMLFDNPKYFETDEGKKQLEIFLRNTNGKCMNIINALLSSIAENNPAIIPILSGLAQQGLDILTDKAIEELPAFIEKVVTELDKYYKKALELWASAKDSHIVEVAMNAFSFGITPLSNKQLAQINDRLDQLVAKLNVIESKVDALLISNLNHFLIEPATKIRIESQVIMENINNGKHVEEKEIEGLLKYIATKLEVFMKESPEIVSMDKRLELLYEIMPIAVNMMNLYYGEYYDQQNGNMHPLHKSLKGIIKKVSGEDFCSKIEDYYYLEERNSGRKVDQIVKCHKLVCQSLIASMDDTFTLRSGASSKEEYQKLCKLSDQLAEALAEDYVQNMENQSADPEIQGIITESAKKVFGTCAANSVAMA